MRSLAWLVTLPLLALPLTGCTNTTADDCQYGYGEAVPADPGLRNPDSGQCEYWGGGGGGGCGDVVPVGVNGADLAANPDWAVCYGACDGLDETTCQATSGCRAIYVSDCPEGSDCLVENFTYAACWGTAPSGPIEGGGCAGLNAQDCSRHDDCVAHHYPDLTGGCDPSLGACDPPNGTVPGNFESCEPEAGDPNGCFDNSDCPSGQHCDAADACLPSPTPCTGAPADAPCNDSCYGHCVPDTPPTPGNCYDQAVCAQPPPNCPDGTIAGVANGCWTGYCIPVDQCETPPACADTPTEQGCVARADCTPIYQGVNCTCDASGACTCQDWLYKSCDDAAPPPTF